MLALFRYNMKLLLTAKQRGSTNALAPIARELQTRGHQLTLYATGNDNEALGFNGLPYQQITPAEEDYARLVRGYDAVILGLSGKDTPDGHFLRAATTARIPTLAVLDQNGNYEGRLGSNPVYLPTVLAVMDETCLKTAGKELTPEMLEEAAKRSKIVGWPAFDHFAVLRQGFSAQARADLLKKLGLNPDQQVYFHATQNIHPNSDYSKRFPGTHDEKLLSYSYELNATDMIFEVASDLNLKLVVKPHPGEEYVQNKTREMAEQHGFTYLQAKACNTVDLILSAASITATRSSCLTEATLLDKNTGAILPDSVGRNWGATCQPVALGAIPAMYNWNGGAEILSMLTSSDQEIQAKLAQDRKKFSVDGKASQRLAELVESLR